MVRVWSVSSAARKQSTLLCGTEVVSLTWAEKVNNMLLIGTDNGKVKVWNPYADKLIGEITTNQPRVLDIATNHTSSSIVTACCSTNHSAGSLCVWSLKTMQMVDDLTVDTSAFPNCAAFNENGSLLAVGGADGMVQIFDMNTNSAIMGWNAHDSEVLSVQFSDDEKSIFSLGKDGKLRNSSIPNIGKVQLDYSYEGFLRGIDRAADIAFEASGHYFAVGSKNNKALVYKVESPDPVQLIGGHTSSVVAVDWTKNLEGNTYIVTGSLDHTVRLTELS